jgi:hypothetical protein
MASLSGESLLLAGFALAHATWSVSDTADDELLCPLAIVEATGQRRLVRFEADTQEAAIESVKRVTAEFMRNGEAFAAAREGLWRPNGPESPAEDVLTVEFWAPGMDAPAATLQPFRRARDGHSFVLLAEPMLVLDGVIVPHEDARPALELLMEGVHSHAGVSPLWGGWQPS